MKHNCETCVVYSSFGLCANPKSPLYGKQVVNPYVVCNFHKKTIKGNYVKNKIVTIMGD